MQADRLRFKEILFNLLSNAIKFTPSGGRVWIESSLVDGSVCILVGDTGIGISPEDQQAIFESFRQASATTKGVREGTGSGPGHHQTPGGASWRKNLGGERAWAKAAASSSLCGSASPRKQPATRSRWRRAPLLLVASHLASWRDEILQQLQHEGFRVETAGSGADAFQKARDLRPDLVLLDMELLGKSGWETLHELKTSPETRAIPVIIVSAADERKMGAALGAAESLVKPVSGAALIQAVRRVLQPEGVLRVLIVDDDLETRELLADTLMNEGHTPLTARYAAEALRILATSRVDAVVLDLLLPGRSGFEVLSDIRANPQAEPAPGAGGDRQGPHRARTPVAGRARRPDVCQRRRLAAGASGQLRRLRTPGQGKRVLVADDNPAGRELVRESLAEHASSIIEAADGREALDKIRELLPDLVLLDIQMPEMDGYAVLREIRSDPALAGPARGRADRLRHAGRPRARPGSRLRRLLTKPVTVAKLKAQLEPEQPPDPPRCA